MEYENIFYGFGAGVMIISICEWFSRLSMVSLVKRSRDIMNGEALW